MLSPPTWGAGGSTVAVSSRAAVSAAAEATALNASALSVVASVLCSMVS